MLDTQTYRRLLRSTLERLSNNVQDNLDNPYFPVTVWIDNYQVYQAHTAPYQSKTLDDIKDGSDTSSISRGEEIKFFVALRTRGRS